MVRGETLSDAVVYNKVNLLKKDFFGYIDKNTGKVDANLPVFFSHVVSALENSFPNLSDEQFDAFIDSITFRILDAGPVVDPARIENIIQNATRVKRCQNARRGIDIVVGLKLLKSGNYGDALEYLKNFWNLDVMLGTAVAFCYYSLSGPESSAGKGAGAKPGEMELLAREKMLDLSRKKPPLQKLPQLDLGDSSFLDTVFWQILFLALEWYPHEPWFVTIGLEKTKATGNSGMRQRLLAIGAERFFDDINVLREMYYSRIETKDIGGAAGIVNHLLKRYPDSLEPVLLGLNLSLLTTKKITFHSFRKLAVTKGMPSQILELYDFEYELLNNDTQDAPGRLAEIEKHYPYLGYYVSALRYLAKDVASADEQRRNAAKMTLFDSIGNYCSEVIRGKFPFQ